MNEKGFSSGIAIKYGWETMRNNLGFFIGVLLLAGAVTIIPSIIQKLTQKSLPVVSILFSILAAVLQMIVSMGLIKIALNFVDNVESRVGALFSCISLFFKYLLSSIVYGLIVIGGAILLIVPGIIWGIKFQFYSYFIVTEGAGPIEALKRSAALTQGAKWDLLALGFLLGLINLLGALCLLIGLFATIPTVMVALAFVFRRLQALSRPVPETGETSLPEPPATI